MCAVQDIDFAYDNIILVFLFHLNIFELVWGFGKGGGGGAVVLTCWLLLQQIADTRQIQTHQT